MTGVTDRATRTLHWLGCGVLGVAVAAVVPLVLNAWWTYQAGEHPVHVRQSIVAVFAVPAVGALFFGFTRLVRWIVVGKV